MALLCQREITKYLYTTLNAVIKDAIRAGRYDLGIKHLSGRQVEFAGPPRVFRFRGLEAEDESVFFFKVNVDTGIESSTAMELYNEANSGSDDTTEGQENGWFSRVRTEITNGFYIDDRSSWKITPKVFLFIKSKNSTFGDKVLVVRPNLGKRLKDARPIKDGIFKGLYKHCATEKKVREALNIWDTEYGLADIPSTQTYQFSCPGRRTESMVMAGHIVPILSKVLVELNLQDGMEESMKRARMPKVVRVDTGDGDMGGTRIPTNNIACSPSKSKHSLSSKSKMIASGQSDVGAKVAKILSESVFRGTIVRYKDNGTYPDQDPSGSFFVHLTNGKKLKMGAERAEEAMTLFEEEIDKLVDVGMPREVAEHLEENLEVGKSNGVLDGFKPVLSSYEDDDPEEQEKRYEVHFRGQTPDSIVGLELPNHTMTVSINGMVVEMPAWEKVLLGIANRMHSQGVESARQVHTLKKHERKQPTQEHVRSREMVSEVEQQQKRTRLS